MVIRVFMYRESVSLGPMTVYTLQMLAYYVHVHVHVHHICVNTITDTFCTLYVLTLGIVSQYVDNHVCTSWLSVQTFEAFRSVTAKSYPDTCRLWAR